MSLQGDSAAFVSSLNSKVPVGGLSNSYSSMIDLISLTGSAIGDG